MRIGFTNAGEMDAFAGERYFTRFFFVGCLFFPIEGYYESLRGTFAVPARGASVGLAYLRFYSFAIALLALLGCCAGLFERSATDLLMVSLPILAITGPLAWWAHSCTGLTSPEDAARRAVLAEVTGIGALPEWLSQELIRRTHAGLLECWESNRRRWREPRDWRGVVLAGARHPDANKLLAALASYDAAQSNSRKARALSDAAWARALGRSAGPAARPPAPVTGFVSVRCDGCRTVTRTPARLTGRRIRCGCKRELRIPAVETLAA